MKRSGRQNNKGFTLIESIIAIVAAAILATMIFTYSGTSLTKSAQPLIQSKASMDLEKVMENILADYNKYFKKDLVALQTKIGTPGAGPITTNYGTYILVDNDFYVVAVRDPPLAEDNKILRVTIKNDLGETLTILLTKQE
jgi:prepilin-type N-terminal cleavage/methylation domain-containing protein